MKKILGLVLMLGLGLVFVSSSQAAPVTLTDTVNFYDTYSNPAGRVNGYNGTWMYYLSNNADYISWFHQFTITQPIDHVTSASLSFYLRDDSVTNDDSTTGGGDGEEDYSLTTDSGNSNPSGDFDTGIFYYNITDLTDFKTELSDGKFYARIDADNANGSGDDFYVDWATLSFTYEPVSAVPEPASMSLLGLGLLGAIGAGLKRKKIA